MAEGPPTNAERRRLARQIASDDIKEAAMIYMGVSREQLINAWKQHGRADPEVFNDKMLEMFCFRTRCTRQGLADVLVSSYLIDDDKVTEILNVTGNKVDLPKTEDVNPRLAGKVSQKVLEDFALMYLSPEVEPVDIDRFKVQHLEDSFMVNLEVLTLWNRKVNCSNKREKLKELLLASADEYGNIDPFMVEELIPSAAADTNSRTQGAAADAVQEDAALVRPRLTCEKYKIETKGLVLIVNQVHYPSELMGSPRKGSEVDCNRLTEVFCSLGYRPVTLVDLTAQDLLSRVESFARDEDHGSSVVVVVMSHGSYGRIFGTDGKDVSLNDLVQPFKPSRCPALAGKPKMFLVQACRTDDDRPVVTRRLPSIEYEENSEFHYKLLDQTVPEDADIILGFSTSPGLQSYRNTVTGTVYIQTFCDVVEAVGPDARVDDILITVNREVGRRVHYEGVRAYKLTQQPEYTSRLTRIWEL